MDDSIGFLFLIMGVLAVVILVVVLRLRGRARPPRPGGAAPDEGAPGTQPLHRDPDPERMAGGRASSHPPGRSSDS